MKEFVWINRTFSKFGFWASSWRSSRQRLLNFLSIAISVLPTEKSQLAQERTPLLTLPRFNSFYFYISFISQLITCTDLLNNLFCNELSHKLSFGHLKLIHFTLSFKTSKSSNLTFPGIQNIDIILSLYERIRKFLKSLKTMWFQVLILYPRKCKIWTFLCLDR